MIKVRSSRAIHAGWKKKKKRASFAFVSGKEKKTLQKGSCSLFLGAKPNLASIERVLERSRGARLTARTTQEKGRFLSSGGSRRRKRKSEGNFIVLFHQDRALASFKRSADEP